MADGPIAGALTFATAIDNSNLEKGLQDAEKKVEDLKKRLESKEAEKSSIEQQMEEAQAALAEASAKADELRDRMEYLNSIDITNEQWSVAQMEIEGLTEKLREAEAEEDRLVDKDLALTEKWQAAQDEVSGYSDRLRTAEAEQSELAERVGSVYYQAGVKVRESFNGMTSALSQFGSQIGRILQQTFVFNVFSSVLRSLKNGIADALMQNDQFSASWEQLKATAQGFANGIANYVAPVISQVVKAVSSSVMALARLIDGVLGTGLVKAIGASRKSAEEAWRQTDESKAAAKEAEQNAKAREKQQEQYAKAVEQQKKREEQAAKRLADAQEQAAERQAKAAQKYPDALEDAAERQAKAEADMQKRIAKAEKDAAERRAKAEESAQERYQNALESAQKRQAQAEKSAQQRLEKAQKTAEERRAKAEESAAERNAAAQEAYEKKVAAAQERSSKAAEKAEKRRTKQAEKLEKAQKKANATLLGFDELNKMNEESTESVTEEVEDYSDSLEDVEPPKTYDVDYDDYVVDPSEYAIDPEDLEKYAIDPSDYVIDPEDYAIDYEDYQIDPSKFFVDPSDYTFDPMDYWIDPEDYAAEAMEFDWEDIPEIDPTTAMKPTWDALGTDEITDQMIALEAALSGLLIALGAILAFSGVNVPLGIALMAAGALNLARVIAENWDKLPAEVQGAITGALMLTGIALLVLGAVLAFSGANVIVGVGLMIAGAMLLGYAASLNWDSMSPQLQAVCTTLMAVVGGFLFAFGVFLCVTGNILPGVALMIAGVATVAGTVALNWDALGGTMQEKIAVIGQIVAGALFGLGVMLCLAGHIPLGIGLMIAGVAILGITQVVANWDTIGPLLEEHLNELLAAAMFGLFAIGVLLLLMGNIPFGVGCIVASAIAGVSLAVINWDTLKPLLEEHLNEILAAAMAALFAIGVVLCFIGNLPLGIGCIVAATIAGVTLAVINWDTLKPLLEEHLNEILAVAMGALLAIGVVLCLVGNLPLGIGCIVAATIAGVTLAVINWDSLKPLIEQHLNDILVLAMGALFVIGVILCLVGNLPLGIGCIVASAIAGVTLAVINWDFLKEKAQKVWEGLKQWWANGPAKVFTAEFWQGVFKCIGDAFLGVINGIIEWWNNMWAGISEGLGNLVGATGGSYQSSGTVPSVRPPGLARGAVIPPNRQFMAVLGDQRSGNNIETPEALMRQVVREEAGGMMAEMMMQMQAMGGGVDGGGDTNLTLYIDSEELARATAKGSSSLTRRGVLSPSATFV